MKIQEVSKIKKDTDIGVDVRLEKDNWDDFGYKTLYRLEVKIEKEWVSVGKVRIANLLSDAYITSIGNVSVDRLPKEFVSLGVDEDYYETLEDLGKDYRREILEKLNDIAFLTPDKLPELNHEAIKRSLMRSKSQADFDTLQKYARGENTKSNFTLKYTFPEAYSVTDVADFEVNPHSLPSTNVHAVIGSNGVGKSTFLKSILLKAIDPKQGTAGISIVGDNEENTNITRLIFISYSAFDDHSVSKMISENNKTLDIKYIGMGISDGKLKEEENLETQPDIIDEEFDEVVEKASYNSNNQDSILKGLALDFAKTMYACSNGYRWERWKRAIEILKTDAVFHGIDMERFKVDGPDNIRLAQDEFERLSSGHAISLMIISKLIMHLRERCVVLIDEPESHLHPPLLAALLNALSVIVTDRNGIVILTTHSPVVLQEIPRKCVWVMSRFGDNIKIMRPRIETYGESIGALTREVFNLEIHKSGFHRIIVDLIESGLTYEEICEKIPSMGSEARTLAITLAP